MFFIPDLLNAEELAGIREMLSQDVWVDGRLTAGAGSVHKKHNYQGDINNPAIQKAEALIRNKLLSHPKFKVMAIPLHLRTVLFNRYDEGMQYGDHMDQALLPGSPPIRGDVSMTVFLSDPESYDGGELVIRSDSAASQSVKLPAGHVVVYSAATLHRVNPVTRGSRLGAVSTAQSRVRSEEQRELLADVAQLTRWVQDVAPKTKEEQRANKIYVNLLRMWAD